ncbi:MAG: hypothetical protein ACKVWV_00055 [Planctomycetota bacterium]
MSDVCLMLMLALLSPARTQDVVPTDPAKDFQKTRREAPDPPGQQTAILSPGTDRCMGATWEPTIAVDPNDPLVVATCQFTTIQISFDGGATFPQTITANVPGATPSDPGWCAGGDPSLAFDSQGRLFITYLGTRLVPGFNCTNCPGSTGCSAGRDVFLSGYQRAGNAFALFMGPRNVSALSGHGAPHNADKEWLAADSFAGSSLFSDRLYVVWSDLDQEPWEIWTTFSTNAGQTWSTAQRLSVASEGRRVWPPHVAVAPNHDVYIAYHAQKQFLDGAPNYDVPDGVSGRIIMHRSTDGGATYTKTAENPLDADDSTFSEADMTWNVQHYANGVIPNASYWLIGALQPWIMCDPQQAGRIYVVTNDDPDDDVDSGDPSDVVMARSDDFGATWSAPIKVDDAPSGVITVMPTAAIDPVGGAIVVSWYDSRSGATGASGDLLLDLRARVSWDGGTQWLPSIDINDGQFDPGQSTSCRFCCNIGNCPPGSPITNRIGEYNGVAWGQCTAHFVWADNQTCGGGANPIDYFYDRDAELGGDFTPPTLVCPQNTQIGCDDSTAPEETGFATATDNCDLSPDVGYVDEFLPGNCPPSITISSIRRIWHAFDLAGNINTCEQIISIIDADAPTIHVPPPLVIQNDTNGGVNSTARIIQNWVDQAFAVDACSQAKLTVSLPDVFPADCGGKTTQVLFAAGDECGNGDFAFGSVTVFVKPSAGIPYCFGDGTGTACPCANVGSAGHGCNISQATGGVCLSAQNFAPNGSGGGSVDLLGTNFDPATSPLVLATASQEYAGGINGVPFADGLLCIGSPFLRKGTTVAQDGKVMIHLVHVDGRGRWNYQLRFRNSPIAFCDPTQAFNLSNGVTLTW